MKWAVIVLLFTCVSVYAQTARTFQANVRIYGDPAVSGILTGIMYYDSVAPNLKQRIDFTVGVKELFDYTNRLRYIKCPTTCDTETWNEPQLKYYQEGGDTSTGSSINVGGRTCNGYTKTGATGNAVRTIYVDGSGLPCRADFASGKKIEFTNVAALSDPSLLVAPQPTWACPAQTCTKQIDFVLIFDESGSISSTAFRQEKQFAIDISNAYTFGPINVAMGLVMFSGDARIILQLTNLKPTFQNGVNSVSQRGGSTCIGCAVDKGRSVLSTSGRPSVSKVFIVLTDGANNVGNFRPSVDAAKAANIILFAIGVGDGVVASEINYIASTITGVQTAFFTTDFSKLGTVLNSLILATCIDIPGNPCGAGCKGLCTCNKACVCPDVCDDGNACTDDMCPNAALGCVSTTKTCNDNNACTIDGCDPATGCKINGPVNCNDNSACTNDSCNPAVGCVHSPVDCNDNDDCTADSCAPTTGCAHTPINCDMCKNKPPCPQVNCQITSCDPSNGQCRSTPRNCNDGNACTQDLCDATTGQCTHPPVNCDDNDACTYDFCDFAAATPTGCYHVPYNVSIDCDDYSVCTNDSCDPAKGCLHANITCSDGDLCTQDICNEALGCLFPQVNCLSIPRIQQLVVGGCYLALCSNDHNGCWLDLIPGSVVDNCGVCNGDGSTCTYGLSTQQVAGIGAGVLAAIIIAAIIVAAALGIFGGKKGYDMWLNSRANMQGAQGNPLYTDEGLSGTSPLYDPSPAAAK